ncbi:transcription factor [Schizosaccharomyces octosporus yFS286]|uniref:Transcription factor n=1 Tax=Schizosaccharomyces octosporus (strain yFS286) TaxID=483514 RepID=S9RC35_SCHOY|nr:transcription factor [Schizosaccharomyces octosporus yFS286]EPX71674.1 transcription factor [Schizosaccharomyces octosporus yFS286]
MVQNKACDLCRLKKIKCSRAQPRCQTCTLFQSECHYSNRSRRNKLVQKDKERSLLDISLPSSLYSSRISDDSPEIIDYSISVKQPSTANKVSCKTCTGEPRNDIEKVHTRLKFLEEKVDLLLDIATENSEAKNENKVIELPSLITQIRNAESIVFQHRPKNFMDDSHPHILNMECLFPPLLPRWDNAFQEVPMRETALELITSYFQHVNWWWPTFILDDFMYEFESFYLYGFHTNNAWLISFYSILALSCIRKRLNSSKKLSEAFFSTAWVYAQNFDFFLSPQIDKVQALIVMTQYAAYLSDSSLCRALCGQACLMAQQLNLHKKPSDSLKPEIKESYKRIFWMCYILDKNISLVFGTPSAFHDNDINCELPDSKFEHLFGVHKGGDSIFIPTVSLTIIQSEIRTRLYSVKSPKQMAAREKFVSPIHQKLIQWEESLPNEIKLFQEMLLNNKFSLSISQSDRFEYLTFAVMEVSFSYLNTIIVLHSSCSQKENQQLCIKAAREAVKLLKSRLNVDLRINVKADPLWMFLYCPFTPFLVIFDNLFLDTEMDSETLLSDLELLHVIYDFFLEMGPISRVALKLVTIVEKFLKVAKETFCAKNSNITETAIKDTVEGFELDDFNNWDLDGISSLLRNF